MTESEMPPEQMVERAQLLLDQGCDREAFEVLSVVAKAGSRKAQLLLGWAYETGRGHEPDASQAEVWYQAAAEQTDRIAMFHLGGLHHRQGNLSAARDWYGRSADLDFSPALYRLALLSSDREERMTFLRLAEERGHVLSAMRLARISLSTSRRTMDRLRAIRKLFRCAAQVLRIGWNDQEDPRIME